MKTKNNTTKASYMKKLIMQGCTVRKAAEEVGVSEGYAYKLLRKSYKTDTGYNKLLAVSRANAKPQETEAKAEAQAQVKAEEDAKAQAEAQTKAEAPAKAKTASQKVIVVEPGYMMAVFKRDGKTALVSFLRKNFGNVYIPEFLLDEMEVMKGTYPLFAEILILCEKWKVTSRFTTVNEARGIINNGYGYRHRSVGIVALARQLRREGNKVEVRTSSWEVSELSELQEAGIKTVKVLPVEY